MSPGGVYVVGFGRGRGGHEEGGEGHIYGIVCVCVCVWERGEESFLMLTMHYSSSRLRGSVSTDDKNYLHFSTLAV